MLSRLKDKWHTVPSTWNPLLIICLYFLPPLAPPLCGALPSGAYTPGPRSSYACLPTPLHRVGKSPHSYPSLPFTVIPLITHASRPRPPLPSSFSAACHCATVRVSLGLCRCACVCDCLQLWGGVLGAVVCVLGGVCTG